MTDSIDGPHDRRCSCGRPAMHTVAMRAFYCCRCWVALGMAPSAWHPECVAETEKVEM